MQQSSALALVFLLGLTSIGALPVAPHPLPVAGAAAPSSLVVPQPLLGALPSVHEVEALDSSANVQPGQPTVVRVARRV